MPTAHAHKQIMFVCDLPWPKHRTWRVFFPWVSVLPIFGSNGAGVPSFGFRPSFLVPSFVRVSFDGRYPGSRSCPVATYE